MPYLTILYFKICIFFTISKPMSYQKENFGMMDEGYFVPRGELIDWINQLLDLNITKIQQLGAGSIYCQIVDVIHPGKVAMNKVNWKAKNDYEFINNLKILQTAFEKVGVKRYVEVEKLAKAKYQDNLQFIQWLKRYYDLNCGDRGKDYNARQRRGNCPVDLSFADKNVVPKTYNSGGQMISKTDLPGKKVNPPVATKIQTKQEAPRIERHPQTKPSIKSVQAVSPSRNDKKRQEPKQMGQSKSNDWEGMYYNEAQKNKDLTIKIGMVEEVLRSDENAQLKVAMLEEIMSIVRNQKMQVESHEMEIQATNQMTNEDDEII